MLGRMSEATARALAPDRMVIRYLDGSTTASPVGGGLRMLRREDVSTARLLAALSTALDLTEGQLPGHALRTAYLAMRVADVLRLSDVDRGTLFCAAFLKDAGCSSNAAAVSRIFGTDDMALKGRRSTIGRSPLDYAAFAIRNLPASEPLPRRVRRLIAIGLHGPAEMQAVEQARCERGASIARKAGFGDAVGAAIHDVHELWDGGGQPRRLAGTAIDRFARIIAVCAGLDVFASTRGRAEALAVVAGRRGTWYEPDVVDALLDLATRGLLDELDAPDLVGRTLALQPGDRPDQVGAAVVEGLAVSPTVLPTVLPDGAPDIDRLASAFADIVDAKSPFTGSHSQRVAAIAERTAGHLGLPERDIVDVRRAGLLHDLGKLGVPNLILDKPGRLDPAEFEVIRRHPELTLRILSPVPAFAGVAEIAACHHERLDGRGYFRGLTEPELEIGARIVAVADVFEALTADRPYRAAMSTEAALAIMREEIGRHLAGDVVDALEATLD
jgi:HD-GYP domain-containing protein (c-di-GMP phosphodiesterase class II)